MHRLLVAFLLIGIHLTPDVHGQSQKGQFELEVVPVRASINGGPYRSRVSIPVGPQPNFDAPALFVQVYAPFQRSFDFKRNFENPIEKSDAYDRMYTARMVGVFHITNTGNNGVGLGQELSFRITRKFYLKSQLAIIWIEGFSKYNDGLVSGLNFHHFWHGSYFLNRRLAMSLGFSHISNGRILSRFQGSSHDVMAIGVSYTFGNLGGKLPGTSTGKQPVEGQ